jgi:hypothetical protein
MTRHAPHVRTGGDSDTTPALASRDWQPGLFDAGPPPAIKVAAPPPQTLYLREPGDSAAISVNDLHQGHIGDCFLISSIGELALTHPGAIGGMIRGNANGTETVTLYTDPNGRLPGFGTSAFKAVAVTVANSFPSYGVDNGATQDVVAGQKEIWPQVLEKAVATLDGGYGAISDGGNPIIAMEELTGHSASNMVPASLTLATLRGFMAAGDRSLAGALSKSISAGRAERTSARAADPSGQRPLLSTGCSSPPRTRD